MKATQAAPIARHQAPSDYERFFDNYYNLGTPSRVFESAQNPSRDRDGERLPVPRRLRRRGRGRADA